MNTPHKRPSDGELDEEAKEANRNVNRIRQVVGQTIADIKSWIIHSRRLRETLAHIR